MSVNGPPIANGMAPGAGDIPRCNDSASGNALPIVSDDGSVLVHISWASDCDFIDFKMVEWVVMAPPIFANDSFATVINVPITIEG